MHGVRKWGAVNDRVSFSAADKLHRFAAGRSLRYHRVDHPFLRSFDFQCRSLFRDLGETIEDDLWYPFVRTVSRYRRAALGAPLPFNDPAIAPSMTSSETEQRLARLRLLYPDLAGKALIVMESLYGLATSDDAPL